MSETCWKQQKTKDGLLTSPTLRQTDSISPGYMNSSASWAN